MGFILLLLFICLCISLLCYLVNDRDLGAGLAGFLVPGIISTILMLAIWGNSYDNTVVMQERLNTIEQYAQTVKSYAKRGVAEFKNGGGSGELTDLKYQNYQTQIGEMIVDLRNQVKFYNTRLIGKNVMSANWFWSWCIIPAPENSVVLKMSDYIE